jgi:DHA2 family multidrug resistance protein-like MFS transporter
MRPGLLGGFGMTTAVTGLLLLAFPPADPGYMDFAWRMALCGWGFAFYLAPNTRMVIGSTPHHRAASVGALISTARLTGKVIGAMLMAILLAVGLATTMAPALIAAAFAAIAGIFSIARLKTPPVSVDDGLMEIPIE